jgi:hypothetical protein
MKTKLKLRIKFFMMFLRDSFRYPTTPRENWMDMKSRYFFATDPEMVKLMDEIANYSKEMKTDANNEVKEGQNL